MRDTVGIAVLMLTGSELNLARLFVFRGPENSIQRGISDFGGGRSAGYTTIRYTRFAISETILGRNIQGRNIRGRTNKEMRII